jgi:hypothetical protein
MISSTQRNTALHFYNLNLLWLAAILISLSVCAFGQAEPDPWLIATTGTNGRLNACTTHEDLIRTFGATNVLDKDEMDGFSGDTEHLTIVYPSAPRRSIEIRWIGGDRKALPESLTISGRNSRWKAMHSISLGTSLKELEQLNGRAFLLSGYDWDYPGRTVTSWENGALAPDLDGGHGETWVRLGCPAPNISKTGAEAREDPSSHNPTLQKVNPRVYEIVWEFPTWDKGRCPSRGRP